MGIYFGDRKSRPMMALTVLFYLGVLGYFKYAGFFVDSLEEIFCRFGCSMDWPTLNVIAPIGISFYTFMCLGYIIDAYLGRVQIQRDIVAFFAMMSFFPQIVAGPIGRVSHLAPQFAKARVFDFDFASNGLCLFTYGLAKKMVVADTLGQYVDKVFAMPVYFDSATCLVAAFFFAMQIYCDFSGYSDMARGSARLLGIDLAQNFNRPYLSSSFGEFWHRWHISLSTWFRDYVYIPLGGSRAGLIRLLINIWIVFLLSGLWHGAAWTFVIWGGMHAIFLSVETLWKKQFGTTTSNSLSARKLLGTMMVFVCVVIAWVVFRSPSFSILCDFAATVVSGGFGWPAGRLDGMVFYLTPYLLIGLLGLSSFVIPVDCSFRSVRARFMFISCCTILVVFMGIPCGGEFIYQKF